MNFTKKEFKNEVNILVYPDPLVTQTVTVDQNLAVEEDGRKVVKAGTVWPTNDEKAQGIILHDCDVTNGDNIVAMVIEGYVKAEALPTPLGTGVNLQKVTVLDVDGNVASPEVKPVG